MSAFTDAAPPETRSRKRLPAAPVTEDLNHLQVSEPFMVKKRHGARAWCWSLAAAAVAAGTVVAAQEAAEKVFKPPRVAVVDLQKVFELYDKKKDRKTEFEGHLKKVDDTLKAMESRLKQIDEELPNLEAGERKVALEFERFRIERDGKALKDSEAKRLQDLELKFFQELRDEISTEIQSYAEALDLDLVLEKTISAEVGPRASVRWAIVHYSKPELEITAEIAARLNSRYKNARPAPAVAPPGGAAVSPPSPPASKATPPAPGGAKKTSK